MKPLLLIATFILLSYQGTAQMTIGEKPLSDEQKKMVKETFSKQNILTKTVRNSCDCIDSISIRNKIAKENAFEVKKCIDKEVISYQSALKLFETIDAKAGEAISITIDTNPDSQNYKSYYFEIERQLMDSCAVIKSVVGMNNREGEKSISTNPNAIKEYNKGNEYIRKDDFANALPFYKKAVKIDPEFVFAWDNIGVCNRRLGNFDEAIAAYKKSIKLDPGGVTALQNIALAYVSKKNYQKAIDSYTALAKLDKNNPEVYYGIGLIYFLNLSDDEKALDHLCKAYNLYVEQHSPFRTDAEKLIQQLYAKFKEKGDEATFDKILDANNIPITN